MPWRKSRDILAERKERFAEIVAHVSAHGGWVTSIPGGTTVTFEVLPDSALPAQLIAMGHDVVPDDPEEGQRILASAIVERMTLTSSGAFEPMTEGSTKTVHLRTHAGIVRVRRYRFAIS